MNTQPDQEWRRVADAITDILRESGMSDEAFSRQAGVNSQTVRRILDGETRKPYRKTLAALSRTSGRPDDALEQVAQGAPLPPRQNEPAPEDEVAGRRVARLEETVRRQSETLDEVLELVKELVERDAQEGR